MKHLIQFLGVMSLAANCFADHPPHPRNANEFFLAETAGEEKKPDSFALNHARQKSWPASTNEVFLASANRNAYQSFQEIKFKGLSKGRRGVWQTVGPVTKSDDFSFETWNPKNTSGRVTDLAIGNNCTDDRCRLYVGTAGGGVWRTDRALHPDNPGWTHLSNGLGSNNIGSISIDPNDPLARTLYVGTGETNSSFTSGAGLGVYVSTNGGDSFEKLPTSITDPDVQPSPIDFTLGRGVSRVAVKPGDPQTIYIATTTAVHGLTAVRGGQATITGYPLAKPGLYKTSDGGANWSLLFEAPINEYSGDGTPDYLHEIHSGVRDVQLDPQDADTVYITVFGEGLYRSSVKLDGDAGFRQIFQVVGFSRVESLVMFDLAEKAGATVLYAYNGNDIDHWAQAFYRVDDAHVPAAQLFNAGANSGNWLNQTSTSYLDHGAFASFDICDPQCVYDLTVKVPNGHPDMVYLAGNWTWTLSDTTVRSTDGGTTFKSFSYDLQEEMGVPHVDVRALAFHPDNPDIVFIGSDGGVVRSNGNFGDGARMCNPPIWHLNEGSFKDFCLAANSNLPEQFIFMNRGLQSMQLYNISADPNDPLKRIMIGTQDNSTQWHDGTESAKKWKSLFPFGDGTSANGFHRENPDILFASFQSNYYFAHFDGGRGSAYDWVHTSGPIRFSGELASPVSITGRQFISFDPSDADTQYAGFEHVWRTQNNGGDRAFLEANCRLWNAWDVPECGDWVPLGDKLTDTTFGDDERKGGLVAAAERSAGDDATLWAATTLGRVFITKNVNQADHTAVEFVRLDGNTTPTRFISGIAVDHENPNRAFVTYSGFNALTPDTPGHVFEVVFDPQSDTASFTAIDHNLGDLPVTHIVRDDLTGDLYISNDYGVLVLPAGKTSWEQAGKGLPMVLTPHLEIHPKKRMLFAATHGTGGWYMNLPRIRGRK